MKYEELTQRKRAKASGSIDAPPDDLAELVDAGRRMSPRLDLMDCETVLQMADAIEAMAAENARLASREQQCVAVKPLVWDGFVSGAYRIEIEQGGVANLWRYSAEMVENEEPTLMRVGYLTLISLDNLKAAAQADYEARTIAALELTPNPVDASQTPDPVVNDPRVKALVEAATALRDQIARWHEGGPAAGPEESRALFEALDEAITAWEAAQK